MIESSYVRRCLKWLANVIAIEYQRNDLSSTLRTKVEKFYTAICSSLEWSELTRDDFLELGFMCNGYEIEDPYELWLIPTWLYPVIPDGLLVMNLKHEFFEFNKKRTPYITFYECMNFGIRIDNPNYKLSQGDQVE